MPVISRLITSVALGCVLASSFIAPVTGSSVQALNSKHHLNKKQHHHVSKAGSQKRGTTVSKPGHCKKPQVTTSVLTTSTHTTTTHSTTHTHAQTSAPAAAVVVKPKPKPTTSVSVSTGGSKSGAAPVPNGPNVYSSQKQGLSWTNNYLNQDPFLQGASWCYNWGSSQDCSKPGGGKLLFIPMFWCTKSISDWQQHVMGKSWQALLGHNEPEISGQCNLSPQAAASQWKQYIEPVDAKVKCSPAVTSSPKGMAWLQEFLKECSDCQIDAIGFHHYGVTAASFITAIEAFKAGIPGKKIWVTEIGCMDYSGKGQYCNQGMADAMMDGVMNYVYGEGSDTIEKIAWYQYAQSTNIDSPANLLISGSGQPTGIGKQFLTYN